MAKRRRFHVLLEVDKESSWFVVTCPALPGCISQGKTKEEALENIKEAITVFIESFELNNEEVSQLEQRLVEVKV